MGEPCGVQTEVLEQDVMDQEEEFISKESLKLLNRIDHLEVDPKKQEVYVRDDFNVYILYECALTDMQAIEQEIIRLGSYYISRMEDLQDTEFERAYHRKDRQEVLRDLLACESKFQFKKVELVQVYMECYEHICDPLEQ
jgi:hypothetical protein